MAVDPVDYEAVLADLEGRRAAFNVAVDSAVSSIKQILALTSGIGIVVGQTASVAKLDSGSFVGLGLTDAAKKYLRIVRQKQSNKDIAEGLEKAGYLHTSKNFTNTIGTALWRAELDGDPELYRQGRFWLLSDWLPGGRKPRKASGTVPEPDEPEIPLEDAEETPST